MTLAGDRAGGLDARPGLRPAAAAFRRGQPCPAFAACFSGLQIRIEPWIRASALERLGLEFSCRSRPGVALLPDYVLDLCVGRVYPPSYCAYAPLTEAPRAATAPPLAPGRATPSIRRAGDPVAVVRRDRS